MADTKYFNIGVLSEAGRRFIRRHRCFGLIGRLFVSSVFMSALLPLSVAQADLVIKNLTAPNFIVDSNVLTPATYAPKSAMLGAEFCNTGPGALTNVKMYVGDYIDATTATPGVYPKRDSNSFVITDPVTDAGHLINDGYYSLTHEGGSAGTADAFRYIAEIKAGECQVQYWLVSYPATSDEEKEAASALDPRKSVTGGDVGPEDDLRLYYDFWAETGGVTTPLVDNKATMRNEISAMANKIWPNGDNKVPTEYKEAIDQLLGWDTATPSGTTDTYPGDIAVAQGVWYDFGVVGAGFDNDGDLVPDHNAWAQPIGDAGAYDPGCFRLVSTEAYVLVKRQDGSIDIYDYKDRLYFENMPDNTGSVGLVFYYFTALDGKCTAALSPYQEVASGYDNEKFNGDYGVGTPPLQSISPSGELLVDKNGPLSVTIPTAADTWADMHYEIAYWNNRATEIGNPDGLVVSVGDVTTGMTMVVRDTVPAGTFYKLGTAQFTDQADIPPAGAGEYYDPGVILFSTDGGITWSEDEPTPQAAPNSAYAEATDVRIQWWIDSVLPSTADVDKGGTGVDFSVNVDFYAGIPYGYSGTSVICNTGEIAMGTGPAIDESTACTLLSGPNTLSGTVFKDLDIDGVLDTGEEKLGFIEVKLYSDFGVAVIEGLLDINNDGMISAADDGTFGGYTVIDGWVDWDGDGNTGADTGSGSTPDTGDDGSIGIDHAWTVIDGKVNVDTSNAVIDTADDGRIWDGVFDENDMLIDPNSADAQDGIDSATDGSYSFTGLPDGVYFVKVDTEDSELFTGAAPTTATTHTVRLDIVQGDGNDAVAVDSTDNDFGFIEPLKVSKAVTSTTDPYGDGEEITYSLTVENQLPAQNAADSPTGCVYDLYPTSPLGSITEDAGVFIDPLNFAYLDDQFGYFVLPAAANSKVLMSTGVFPLPTNYSGNITDINVVFQNSVMVNGTVETSEYTVELIVGGMTYDNTDLGNQISNVVGGAFYEQDVKDGGVSGTDPLPTWDELANASATLNAKKDGSPTGNWGLDSFALRVYTDAACPVGSDNIITNVKLQDSYEKAKLTYVSSNPTRDSEDTSDSTNNVLIWDNVGPLAPGESKLVTVVMQGNNDTTAMISADNTALVAANDASFGDGDPANSDSDTSTVDIYPAINISGTLFADNAPGWNTTSPDYGDDTSVDTYIPGQIVELYACVNSGVLLVAADESKDCNANSGYDWEVVATTMTEADGSYIFEGVLEGYYFVKAPDSVAGSSTVTAAPPDVNNPTAAGGLNDLYWYDPTNGGNRDKDILTTFFRVGGASGNWTDTTNVDFGYGNINAVSGYVWEDADGDGMADIGDTGLSGITVELIDCGADNVCGSAANDDSITTTTTDADGLYEFTGLTDGQNYRINVLTLLDSEASATGDLASGTWDQTQETADGQAVSPGNDASIDQYIDFTAATSKILTHRDFGYQQEGTRLINGMVYYDWNGDGDKDTNEPGTASVTVYLYLDKNGDGIIDPDTDTKVGSVVTASDGSYAFNSTTLANFPNGLPPEQFIVLVDETDTDGNLNLYQQIEDPDVAAGGGVCVGTQCDDDGKADVRTTNKAGVDFGYQPQGANAISGQIWRDLDSDTNKDGGQEVGIADVTVTLQWLDNGTWYDVRTTLGSDGTTDVDGDGNIDLPGSYYFGDLPDGSFRVKVSENDTELPVDGAGQYYTPTTGTDNGTNRYFEQNLSGGTASTDNNFGFTSLGAIGDTVYMDVNGDGEQDTLEPGIKDVVVELWTFEDGSNGQPANGKYDIGENTSNTGTTDTTDADGRYLFDALEAGHYLIRVDTATLPETSPGVPLKLIGDPDSDGVPCNGTDGTKFCDNQHGAAVNSTYYLGADFGYEPQGVLGDTLWLDANGDGLDYFDLNGNGQRDPDELEPRLVGVTVSLYNDVNGDGVFDGGDTLVKSVETDADGMYVFTEPDLVAGYDYVVVVDSADLPDMTATTDRDNGTPPNNETPISNWVSGAVVDDADFGFRYAGTTKVAGTVCFETDASGYCGASVSAQGVDATTEWAYEKVSLNLYIWNDVDTDGVVDLGETTFAGMTYTDGNGDYSFDNLPDDTQYVVSMAAPEANLIFNTTESILDSPDNIVDDLQVWVDGAFVTPTASTTPASGIEGSIILSAGNSVTGLDFAFTQNFDYGDLPFATLRRDSGARHIVKNTPDLYLGSGVTKDSDGIPSFTAEGEIDTTDDGITLVNPLAWTEGTDGGTIQVEVGAGDGWLMGWIDFNNDGIFDAADDMVISQAVSTGTVDINIDIPTGGLDTMGYARFRLFPSEPTIPALAYLGTATNGEVEDYAFFTSSIGDRIWLDENGDGVQDAGEAGIANVTVKLCDAAGANCRETVTDTDGSYIFSSIGAGTYNVVVDPSTLPSTLKDNPTFNYDTTLDHTTEVEVGTREEFVDADFGYNYVSKISTDNPSSGATGAIGDRVWNDGNGDGVQDPEEAGIAGVTVTLYDDSDGDGVYDNNPVTVVTDAAGNYIFTGIAAGGYKVVVSQPAGTNQTGDPDLLGVPSGASGDNATTAPIILAPGDVYVNADFGYQYITRYDIGDKIYRDLDGNGVEDGSDSGIPGVTVVLKDASGKIIATDVTDINGEYKFIGMSGGVDYTVEVTDTAHVLGELTLTGDPDSTVDGSHTITGLNASTDTVDFGYAPLLYARDTGAIGDIVFLDSDQSDTFNLGEALEGVKVELYKIGESTPVRITYTDENGNYMFAGLGADTYEIKVDQSTLPDALTATDNNVFPAGGGNGASTYGLSDGEINLDQDFGYKSDRSISGTIWDDGNADGRLTDGTGDGEPNETGGGIEGVTVVLIDKSTGNVVARTTADASGNYEFKGLPADEYEVHVTDDIGELSGYWHTVGSDQATDNYSKTDPYTVDLTTGTFNNTADFGYYKNSASVGNYVWQDNIFQNGLVDGGDTAITGHEVTLIITYPNGDKITLVTKTDGSGLYNFANLLADEDYNASKTDSADQLPTYIIQTLVPAGMESTHTLATDVNNLNDQADNPEAEFVALIQGQVLDTKDFAFYYNGAIGDYVWLDTNGDGVQDNNEPPLDGVTVKLYRDVNDDGVLDGSDGGAIATVITAFDGSYMFENLTGDNYLVQIDSGVPSGLEVTTTHTDTTDPDNPYDLVILAANGFVDTIDFGFSNSGVLGDTVWFDANADGIQNPGEIGIGGVKLYICDGDEATCDASTAEYTVTTDIDGTWLQTGLTPDAKYTVAVDTDSSALSGLNTVPTNDSGAVRKVYTLPASGGVLIADYGFTDDATPNYGTVGDRVYLENSSNTSDDGQATDPGIEGVVVDLQLFVDGTWTTVAQTTTDATGNYLFSGVKTGTDYRVRLNSSNPNLVGLSPTQEPSGGTGYYAYNSNDDGLNYVAADYGFEGAGIGDYVWFDSTTTGTVGVQDSGEGGIGGVTVELYLDNGTVADKWDGDDTPLRTTTTDSNGRYLFSGIETGQKYIVKVTPPANFTPTTTGAGTTATDSNGDANFEAAVTLGGATDLTIDFGLQGGSFSIGDYVWYDSNGDGDQDEDGVSGAAAGIEGVTIDLYLGDVRIATTVTAADGSYNFDNLPANTYEVRITDQNHKLGSYVSTTGGDSQTVALSASVDTMDFGYGDPIPTYAVVSTFKAYINADNQTVLEWTTASEIGTLGFLLERLNEQSGKYQAVTKRLLPGMLSPPHGGTYRYVDKKAELGKSCTYRVVEVAVNNQGTVSGPYTVRAEQALPVNNQMFADGPEGYTLTHETFSQKQLKRFAARDEFASGLASAKKKKTGDTLKIPVSEKGLVYLSTARLASSSGLSERQVAKYLKSKKCLVTLKGESIPVITANTGSGLWFYGQAPTRNDIGQNIYLLELGVKGVKMKNTPGRAEEIISDEQSFIAHTEVEENHQPFHLYINTPVSDFWAWEYLLAYGGEHAVTHTVAAPHLTGAGDATITVNLVGVGSRSSGGQAAPYKVTVSLNGTSVGTAEWSAKGDYQFQTEVASDLLLESGNEVRLVSQLNSGIVYSLIYLESIEVDYERSCEAVNGELIFADVDYDSVTVKGFSSSNLLALDITNPDKPLRMRTLPGKNEVGEYTVTILTEPDHEYFITENISQTVSGDITVDSPSQLRSVDNQADYLIISPLNLIDSVQRLADLRAAQGMVTMVVDIEDVQDEFSGGLAAPEAVHDFLAYVHANWTLAPKYVVLVGDGSYDYKDHLGYGYPLVPSVLVATDDGFFPSDNFFADVVGDDGVPEFAIGRIPAVDTAELNSYIDKLTAYEQSVQSESTTVMSLVTDKSDPAAGDFQASADKVAALMPDSLTVNRFDVDTLGNSETHAQVVNTLRQGAGIMHYIGHSSLVAYGRSSSLLTADQIDAMSDIGSPMLMVSMACSTASIGYPAMNSIGESAVLKADGAAVGFFGATGLSRNYLADIMTEGFYRSLFDPTNTRVGDALVQGKQYYSDQGAERSVLDIYNLLGDPAMLAPVQQ